MKTLEKGQDKIQKICDILRKETIEPAKEESQKLLKDAQTKANEIITQAERQAEQLLKQARTQIEQERNVFNSSLQQAAKQSLEAVRQELERKLFSDELQSLLSKQTAEPDVVAQIINALVKAVEKEGISTDLTAVIPRAVSAQSVSQKLLEEVKNKLQTKPLELGHFAGGAQLKLVNNKMTLDFSDQALKELLSNYVRKDFRQLFFGR